MSKLLPENEEDRGEKHARLRNGLRSILQSSVYCGICLDSNKSYTELNLHCKSRDTKNITIEDMIKTVFTENILEELPTPYLCETCQKSVLQAYNFISKYLNTARIFNDYIDQIDFKFTEVYDSINTHDADSIANVWLVLENRIDMEKNPETENLKQKFICNFCKKEFSSKTEIAIHMRLHTHADEYFNCPDCKTMNCIHKKYLKKNLFTKNQEPRYYNCIDCNYKCMNTFRLIVHVNKNHLNHFPHLCELCGKAFPTKVHQTNHLKVFHLNTIRCGYCDDLFPEQNDLISHRAVCKNKTKNFQCEICPVSFDSRKKLDVHCLNHKYEFSCKLCSKSFREEKSLKRHLKNHSSSVKIQSVRNNTIQVCSVCQKEFKLWNDLMSHLKTHSPSEMHSCSTCNKEFSTRRQYVVHSRSWSHLTKVDPNFKFNFQCDLCDYSCAAEIHLENHKNVVHFKTKPYKCDKCEKAFTTQVHLKNHLETHEKIRKFECGECRIQLTSLSGLKKHILRLHSLTKPFPCHLCKRSFSYSSERLLHLNTTHSEKKLPCPVCKRKFHTRFTMKCHVQKVHMKGIDKSEFLKKYDSEEMRDILRDNRKRISED